LGFGFVVLGFRFWVSDSAIRIRIKYFKKWGSGFRVEDLGEGGKRFRVSGLGCNVMV